MIGSPFRRRPLRRDGKLLLCQTGPEPQPDGTYRPRWHLATLSRRRLKPHWPRDKTSTLWHYKDPKTGKRLTRVWAYVPRCGSGHGYQAERLNYGTAPTCKRCLRRIA